MRQLKIGATRVDRLVEIDRILFDKTWLFSNANDEVIETNRHWLDERFIEPVTGRLVLSHHSYLVRTDSWTAIIDTCCGNDKERRRFPFWNRLNQPYLENLMALGVLPEEVDFVMCTHLHVDHVGWNTKLVDGRWVPTFPKASYLMGRIEYDYWERQHQLKPKYPINEGSFNDSVLPVLDAGQAKFVEFDHCVFDDRDAVLRFTAAPGHSAGNAMIHLHGGNDHAVFSGDVIHHPIQCAAPWLSNAADFDPHAALATRVSLLRQIADTPAILLTGHFPTPTAGRVVSHSHGFRFQFDE